MDLEPTTEHETPDKRVSWSWVKAALKIREVLDLGGKRNVYLWAILVGIVGALVALLFAVCTHLVQDMLTGTNNLSQYKAFSHIEPWHRVAAMGIGGLLSGAILLFTHRFVPAKATEYMEAIALGDGTVPVKPSLLRTLSAVFTVGCGAAIGREGPLVQAAAVSASSIGRYFRIPTPRLRLMVACAAAAGLSAAFHTPLAGGLFVAEIVLGALTIDLIAPLLVASCAGYFTLSLFIPPTPIYPVESVAMNIDGQGTMFCILLAIIAAFSAQGWLKLLKLSRRFLNGNRLFLPLRMCLAGCLVGGVAVWYPEIVGNGAIIIDGLVHKNFSFYEIGALLGIKVLCVALFFGVGTVGGVLTPSLTIGGILGFLFSGVLTKMGVPGDHAVAYSLIGMAAFFTTSASAPLTSLVLVIEFTMAGELMFPLIVAVLVSHGISKMLKVESMYHDSLSFGPRSLFTKPLGKVRLREISRKAPPTVLPQDSFSVVATQLLKNPAQGLFMVSAKNRYLGVIHPSDVIEFAKNPDLAEAVLALDVAQQDISVLSDEMKLPEALEIFARDQSVQSLPMLDEHKALQGVVNRMDLYLVLNEIMRREKLQ